MTFQLRVSVDTEDNTVWNPGELRYVVSKVGNEARRVLDPEHVEAFRILVRPRGQERPVITLEARRSGGGGWGRPPPTPVVAWSEAGERHCAVSLSALGGLPAGEFDLEMQYLGTDFSTVEASATPVPLHVQPCKAVSQSIVTDCPTLSRVLILTRDENGGVYLRKQLRSPSAVVEFERCVDACADADEVILAQASFFTAATTEFVEQTRTLERRGSTLGLRILDKGLDRGICVQAELPPARALAGVATWDPSGATLALGAPDGPVELWRLEADRLSRVAVTRCRFGRRLVLAGIRGEHHVVSAERGLRWAVFGAEPREKDFGPFGHAVRSVGVERKSGQVLAVFDAGHGARSMRVIGLNLRTGDLRERELGLDELDSEVSEFAVGMQRQHWFGVARTKTGGIYVVDRGRCRRLDITVDDPERPSFLFASTHGRPCFGLSSTGRGIEMFHLDGRRAW